MAQKKLFILKNNIMYKIGELTTVSMGKSIGKFTGYPLIKGIEIIKMFKFEADAIEYLNQLNSKLEKKNK